MPVSPQTHIDRRAATIRAESPGIEIELAIGGERTGIITGRDQAGREPVLVSHVRLPHHMARAIVDRSTDDYAHP